MKKFLTRSLAFLLLPILYFLLNGLGNYYIYLNHNSGLKERDILIMGDSHPQKSLDPRFFDNAANISQVGEPYILTYWKLKKILKEHKPDTVIIGFAPHNISAFNDLKFSRKKWSAEMFRRSYSIQDFENLTGIEVDYLEFLKVLWKQTCLFPKLYHHNYIGSYSNSSDSILSDSNLQLTVRRHYYYKGKELGISETAISYLDSTINLLKSHNIEAILVSSPVHERYYTQIPSQVKNNYRQVKKRLENHQVTVIDKTNDFYSDSLYLNSDHLNELGARKFTKDVVRLLIPKDIIKAELNFDERWYY